jgi:uncharacterized membrane protein
MVWVLIIAPFILGEIVWNIMPEMMVSHWNAAGVADGFMPKAWTLFLMPAIGLLLAGLFSFLPKIDPYKENVAKFRETYRQVVIGIFVFLFYIYVLTIAWNLGYVFSFTTFLIPALAILFYGLGWALEKTERNWFMGIRTPWTLSSEKVWKKTHQMGSKVFKTLGVLTLAGLLFSSIVLFWIVVGGSILSSLFLCVYSYLEFKKDR